jgi:hypothetical protein
VAGIFNISFRTGGQGPGQGRPQGMNIRAGGAAGAANISMQGRGMEASDISKIVFVQPGEIKRIGLVLDAQPRAMLINTLVAKNIPGEITLPIVEIHKPKGVNKEFTGEEILTSLPLTGEESENIVDNEDPGFINSNVNIQSPLKKLLGIQNHQGKTYLQVSTMSVPEYWQPVVLSSYYGKYVRSSVYTRGGTGDKTVTWSTPIDEPGYYDIYTHIGKINGRVMVRGTGPGQARPGGPGGGPGGAGGPGGPDGQNMDQGEGLYKDMHFKIYHDEGVEEITFDYENADGGWNNLGRYYLSSDTAKVVLTNQSTGRIVIGDAVKWVKQR